MARERILATQPTVVYDGCHGTIRGSKGIFGERRLLDSLTMVDGHFGLGVIKLDPPTSRGKMTHSNPNSMETTTLKVKVA
jgi:hypothetical protein